MVLFLAGIDRFPWYRYGAGLGASESNGDCAIALRINTTAMPDAGFPNGATHFGSPFVVTAGAWNELVLSFEEASNGDVTATYAVGTMPSSTVVAPAPVTSEHEIFSLSAGILRSGGELDVRFTFDDVRVDHPE
jgi:hypothetical protein